MMLLRGSKKGRPHSALRPSFLIMSVTLFPVGIKPAPEEIYETLDREVVAADGNEHFSVRGEEDVVRLSVDVPLCAGEI